MKTTLVFISILIVPILTFGQANELKTLVDKLQGTFTKVESATKTYEQEIKLLEYSTLTYSYNQTDQKGAKTAFSTDFNLADIDPYAVRQETQKDIIFVVLAARNKQKLIKTLKDGKTQSYDDELRIHAKDGDHAKAILEIIKKCIPLGEKITSGKMKLAGYENMRQWLEGNVKNVNIGTKSINQTLKEQSSPASFKLLQIESDGKTSHQEEFTFNVADINLNTLVFKISGSTFALKFEMLEQLKSVSVLRDGAAKPFTDEVTIYTNGVDEARDMKTVLTMMSPLAQAKVKGDLPSFKNKAQSVETIVALVKDLKIKDKILTQSITPKCLTTFITTEQTAKATVKDTYEFNWMDVNPNAFKLEVSGEKMQIELPMVDKKRLANHYKDDKIAGYESEANIYVEDMEVGRRLRYSIEKAIEYCKSIYKDPFPATTKGMIDWMKQAVTEVTVEQTTRKQIFESAEEGNDNKIKLTTVEIKTSSSVEEIFEFNLSDIDPRSVDFEAKGKWLTVKFDTNFKNKIIKAYKAGKIQPYANSMEIAMKDVETARGFIAALKKCAESLKGK
jgi:acetolactate synthase small subunit